MRGEDLDVQAGRSDARGLRSMGHPESTTAGPPWSVTARGSTTGTGWRVVVAEGPDASFASLELTAAAAMTATAEELWRAIVMAAKPERVLPADPRADFGAPRRSTEGAWIWERLVGAEVSQNG